MSNRRKKTTTDTKQTSKNIPPYYPYSQHGYIPPPPPQSVYHPLYNDPYMYPAPYPSYDDPYLYPPHSYYNSEYFNYYPVDEYGQAIVPPTSFPPIVNPYHQDYHPYSSYVPTYESHVPSSPRDRMLPEDYHYRHPSRSNRDHERSRNVTLPPIRNKQVCIFFSILIKDKLLFSL